MAAPPLAALPVVGVNTSSDTAIARRPALAAVRQAPTVPECSTALPALAPRLMPDSTRVGASPKAPSRPSVTM